MAQFIMFITFKMCSLICCITALVWLVVLCYAPLPCRQYLNGTDEHIFHSQYLPAAHLALSPVCTKQVKFACETASHRIALIEHCHHHSVKPPHVLGHLISFLDMCWFLRGPVSLPQLEASTQYTLEGTLLWRFLVFVENLFHTCLHILHILKWFYSYSLHFLIRNW